MAPADSIAMIVIPATLTIRSKARNAYAKFVHPSSGQNKRSKNLVVVDDTTSASSTDSAERKARKNVLKVAIDETLNVYHDPIEIDFAQSGRLWYNDAECKQLKFENNACIRETYRSGSAESEAYIKTVTKAYVACCETGDLPQAQVQEMRKQTEKCPQHVGLELRLTITGSSDKLHRREELLYLACNLAQNNDDLPLEEVEELMKAKCEEVTLPARLFAEAIGRAHACESFL